MSGAGLQGFGFRADHEVEGKGAGLNLASGCKVFCRRYRLGKGKPQGLGFLQDTPSPTPEALMTQGDADPPGARMPLLQLRFF